MDISNLKTEIVDLLENLRQVTEKSQALSKEEGTASKDLIWLSMERSSMTRKLRKKLSLLEKEEPKELFYVNRIRKTLGL